MKNFLWVLFVSRRFSRVDRKGKSRVTSFLASLGIALGVMTLIVVISVMNGFQMSFIDAIMEVSSYHIRLEKENESEEELLSALEKIDQIKSAAFFQEAQSLMVSSSGKQSPSLVRSISADACNFDEGLKREMVFRSGSFDLHEENSILLGSELARNLRARVGDEINLFALSGGNDVELFSSEERIFRVKGIFRTGYHEINAACAFISLADGKKHFGKNAPVYCGIKLNDSKKDFYVISKIRQNFPKMKCESWKEYNRSFFGALKIEKNIMMLLIFLIFVVVGINIFNGIRRIVFERRQEISIFSSFGANKKFIQGIFIVQGFLIGLYGCIPGLALGVLITVRMKNVFMILSKVVYCAEYFFTMIFNNSALEFVRENPMFRVYSNIPARIFGGEAALITLFGLFSAVIASYIASKNVLKFQIADVLRES